MRILLVEDEWPIANFIREGLEEEGFTVDVAEDGHEGMRLALEGLESYHLYLLDWMLPGISGLEICKAVREKAPQKPIVFITAKDQVDDVVLGFESGANDYIRKPFAFAELLVRLRALLRTSQEEDQQLLRHGSIELYADKHVVMKNGRRIELTQKEFALLEHLLRNKGKVCPRSRIIEQVWDIHFEYDTSVIDVYINFLRKKLDEPGANSFIETVRGIGYRINEYS